MAWLEIISQAMTSQLTSRYDEEMLDDVWEEFHHLLMYKSHFGAEYLQ